MNLMKGEIFLRRTCFRLLEQWLWQYLIWQKKHTPFYRNALSGQVRAVSKHATQNAAGHGNLCPFSIAYIGHIFLLGLAALVGELVNLQAGLVLERLLEPFVCENHEENENAELLADNLEEVDAFELSDGVL